MVKRCWFCAWLPTKIRENRGISGRRWSVLEVSGANSRKSSIYADLRSRQSLHIGGLSEAGSSQTSMNDERMNNRPYSEKRHNFLEDLKSHYDPWVKTGVCMATIRMCNEEPADACEGSIGHRHAIAERHLRLIAPATEGNNREIRANKEIRSFEKWSEQYDALQRVPISQFSAGKWSCQKHDERFESIDAERIDLSKPENLFKAVYRVVLRQNHLSAARWSAHWAAAQTEERWEAFKETAFCEPTSEGGAIEAEKKWKNEAHALMWKMRDLERRLVNREWNSLDCRALLLESEPAVAGWRCLAMKFDVNRLHPDDPRRHWQDHIELGYMIVIPQRDGHAIITACESESDRRFRVPGIDRIHHHMDKLACATPNTPYPADEYLRWRISSRVWELNEIGIKESLYQSWSDAEKDRAQAWMKERGSQASQPPSDLPTFF